VKIRVKSTEVETVRIRGKGGDFDSRRQVAYIETAEEVRKVEVQLGKDQSPYAVGLYGIDDASFRVNQFGRLEVGRLILTPLSASARAA